MLRNQYIALFIILVVCGGYPDRLHAAESETAQATASPVEAVYSMSRGLALAQQGDWAGAATAYREAIRLEPDVAGFHYQLGKALDQQGDYAGAGTAYREALRLNPGDRWEGATDGTVKKRLDALAKKEQAQILVDAMKEVMQQVVKEQQADVPAKEQPSPPPQSDVDSPPTVVAPVNSNAYAVVIGIEQYRQHLPSADFAKHDATIVAQYLEQSMGYAAENIVMLTNEQASLADLTKYVETWLPNQVDANSSVFIYYSGHGSPNPTTGDAYLMPYDGDPAFLTNTGYPLRRLYTQLSQLPAKNVTVVLDTCFSGAGGRSVLAKGARPAVVQLDDPVLSSDTLAVLTASTSEQISSTHMKQHHGLLTYYFLKGLQGEADGNGDGQVALEEVFEYVQPQVARVARRAYNTEQTPQLLGAPAVRQRPLVHLAP